MFSIISTALYALSFFTPTAMFEFELYWIAINDCFLLHLFYLGFRHSMDLDNLSSTKKLFYVVTAPIWVKYFDFLGAIANIWAILTPIKGFDVCKKSFE